MTRTIKFAEAFWDEEFCGTSGYDILLKKLKDGRQMCKDWEHFIKERAKIEEEYGNKLQKLARNTPAGLETGSMYHAWDIVKTRTEAIANEHVIAAKEMTRASERMLELLQKQKAKRTGLESTMQKSEKKKKDYFNKVLESKKSFQNKSVEANNLENVIENHKANHTENQLNQKDWDKMLTKSRKLKTEAEKADHTYKECLEHLEKARQQWEIDMVNTCNEFESLEEERMLYLRNEFWLHTNVISQTAVDDDQHCEEVRLTLETCDVDKDLTDFIKRRKSGTKRPAKIEYEGWRNEARQKKGSSFDRPFQPLPN